MSQKTAKSTDRFELRLIIKYLAKTAVPVPTVYHSSTLYNDCTEHSILVIASFLDWLTQAWSAKPCRSACCLGTPCQRHLNRSQTHGKSPTIIYTVFYKIATCQPIQNHPHFTISVKQVTISILPAITLAQVTPFWATWANRILDNIKHISKLQLLTFTQVLHRTVLGHYKVAVSRHPAKCQKSISRNCTKSTCIFTTQCHVCKAEAMADYER